MTASITGKGLKNECASTKLVRDTEIVLSYSILRSTESAHNDLERNNVKNRRSTGWKLFVVWWLSLLFWQREDYPLEDMMNTLGPDITATS